jgi:ParB-like chromosome segregation protein Spo0J
VPTSDAGGAQEDTGREDQQAPQGGIVVRMLPVSKIVASDYNPNRMTDEELAEYAEEVRHLGRLPQPLVVRPAGDGYVVVDGEHGLKVAGKLGRSEVACEVVEVDDFEARRQTYKRNRHGTTDQVRLGRMFRQMMESRGLTGRGLAKEILVTEGTVRNALDHARAADLRNSYAPGQGDEQVAPLPVRQVRDYLKQPEDRRDAWLDTELARTGKEGGPQRGRKQRRAAAKSGTAAGDVEVRHAVPEPAEDVPIAPGTATTGTPLVVPDTATPPEGPAGEDPASLDEGDGHPRGTGNTDVEATPEGQPQRHPPGALEAPADARERAEITVPIDPKELARAVLEKLGREGAAEVHDELGRLLLEAPEPARHEEQTPPQRRRRRKREDDHSAFVGLWS